MGGKIKTTHHSIFWLCQSALPWRGNVERFCKYHYSGICRPFLNYFQKHGRGLIGPQFTERSRSKNDWVNWMHAECTKIQMRAPVCMHSEPSWRHEYNLNWKTRCSSSKRRGNNSRGQTQSIEYDWLLIYINFHLLTGIHLRMVVLECGVRQGLLVAQNTYKFCIFRVRIYLYVLNFNQR